jgi:hypothetical protein
MGIVIYLVLWVVMPYRLEVETRAERLLPPDVPDVRL